ncbi:hypothetical protein CDAR_548111 [Caerostris darwini]|uniref:Uncharacterized protein n=1 Tax=Caerostris darwini TaxID=1538125 RepID=A0AAV4WGT6_9ARAC|nr:hypothetical protein CDAR_548111 [Caerostris darwini]
MLPNKRQIKLKKKRKVKNSCIAKSFRDNETHRTEKCNGNAARVRSSKKKVVKVSKSEPPTSLRTASGYGKKTLYLRVGNGPPEIDVCNRFKRPADENRLLSFWRER